ncbi:hypothetical protein M9H77_08996 [Catharanthus roseus]|uniref:Uncharacterized protein n=1 Tax=Catharanthus roseus TaxID=4058 RepID=A0ACC0BZE4_CATRO|nr:hypothetical protein M9H77_08996 [Catharanthus roseus]
MSTSTTEAAAKPIPAFFCITARSVISVLVTASIATANPIRDYPASVIETHLLIAHEPTEVFHGWFLSVRASKAPRHQSFAIPRSRKVANVTLRASSYLRVS